MRRVLIAGAVATLSLPLLAGSPALAQTSNPYALCDNAAGALCLADANGATNGGNPIIMYTNETRDAQDIAFAPVPANSPYNCSGIVASGCPFTGAASYLDSTYANDSVVEINFDEVGSYPYNGCAGLAAGTANVALESCSAAAADSVWVIAPPKSGSYCSFVNVGYTNEIAEPEVLAGSTTSGDQATVSVWFNGGTQQWLQSTLDDYC